MTPPPPPPHTQPIGLNPPPYFYQMNDQVVDVAHNNIIYLFTITYLQKEIKGKEINFIMYISVNLETSDCFIE